jgi:hypothetical protein
MEVHTIDINPTVWQAMCLFIHDFCEYEEFHETKTKIFVQAQSQTNDKLVTKDTFCFSDVLNLWENMPPEFYNDMMANLLEDTTKELPNENEVLNIANFLKKVHNYLSKLSTDLKECDSFGVKVVDNDVRVMFFTYPRCGCCGETMEYHEEEEESIHEQIRRLPNSILGKHMTRLLSRH